MKENNPTYLIQSHKGKEHFNYDLVVDWALDLIAEGVETENILILASFSKPVDAYEIKPYLTAALSDLDLEEKEEKIAALAIIYFYLNEMINGKRIRDNLSQVYNLSLRV